MLRERLQQLIEPVVEAIGYELVLLEFSSGIRTGTLRLFIDREEGVALDDCERVSREVAALLDVEDPIRSAYQLEVSSPGLDRPLTKLAHYERFAGEKLRVQTLAPINGQKKFLGRIAGVQRRPEAVSLDIGAESPVVIPLAEIERARLVPDYTKEFAKSKN